MKLSPLMQRLRTMTRTRALALALVATVALPGAGWATMAVIDASAISKLTDQLSKLQEQIEALNAISDGVQEQIDAVGRVGQISLPTFSLDGLASSIRRDAQCLLSDLSKLMPSIDFDELSLNSICGRAPVYRETLWLDPDTIDALPTWEERDEARKQVAVRRERVFTDTISKAMAHADVAAQDVEQTNSAASELEGSLASASTSNDRLQAIGQGQVVIVRALAHQNQILAQMLKVQSTLAMAVGVPVEGLVSLDTENPERVRGRTGANQDGDG